MRELFVIGRGLGGQISGEHGTGRDKQEHSLALGEPFVLDLQQRLKLAIDPTGLFNPHRLVDTSVSHL